MSLTRPALRRSLAALVPLVLVLLAPEVGGPASAAPPVAAASACGGERPPKADGSLYTCSFEDDFSGTSLDRTRWVVQSTALSGVPAGEESCYVDRTTNLAVSGGALRLTSRRTAPFTCSSPAGSFTATSTAATIGSVGRFSQTYGRFEFRARFPDAGGAPGLHSALWLYPQSSTYGAWPASGEIDVAEFFSAVPNQAYPSVHYPGENVVLSTGYSCPVAQASSAYHRYAVEWTTTRMRFLYDGAECFTHAWTPDAPLSAPQPFDQPFYVVLSQVMGHAWNAPTSSSPSSGTLLVDWVRVWR